MKGKVIGEIGVKNSSELEGEMAVSKRKGWESLARLEDNGKKERERGSDTRIEKEK